jgi:hypothetical protein
MTLMSLRILKNKNLKHHMKMLLNPSEGQATLLFLVFVISQNNTFISGFHQTWVSMLPQWGTWERFLSISEGTSEH